VLLLLLPLPRFGTARHRTVWCAAHLVLSPRVSLRMGARRAALSWRRVVLSVLLLGLAAREQVEAHKANGVRDISLGRLGFGRLRGNDSVE
jgi:hypothetical protein